MLEGANNMKKTIRWLVLFSWIAGCPRYNVSIRQMQHDEPYIGAYWNAEREIGDNMAVKINTDECIACGVCVDECPQNALSVDAYCEVDEDACIDCGICIDNCPVDALSA